MSKTNLSTTKEWETFWDNINWELLNKVIQLKQEKHDT